MIKIHLYRALVEFAAILLLIGCLVANGLGKR